MEELKWVKGANQNKYTAIPKSSYVSYGDTYSRCFNKMIYLIDLSNKSIDEKQQEEINSQNEINRMSIPLRVEFYKKKLSLLKKELFVLNQSKNNKKIQLISPTIKKQIKEINIVLRELKNEECE